MPRQIPKNGILFSLTCLIADILPSTPLSPNPGATITPSIFVRFFLMFLLSKSSDKIHLISTLEFKFAPAWIKDSDIDLYASWRETYLPIIAIFRVLLEECKFF